LSLEWNRDAVMHSENGDNDGDEEPVRERWDDSDRDSYRQVGEVPWEVHSRDDARHGEKSGCWLSKRNKKVDE